LVGGGNEITVIEKEIISGPRVSPSGGPLGWRGEISPKRVGKTGKDTIQLNKGGSIMRRIKSGGKKIRGGPRGRSQ